MNNPNETRQKYLQLIQALDEPNQLLRDLGPLNDLYEEQFRVADREVAYRQLLNEHQAVYDQYKAFEAANDGEDLGANDKKRTVDLYKNCIKTTREEYKNIGEKIDKFPLDDRNKVRDAIMKKRAARNTPAGKKAQRDIRNGTGDCRDDKCSTSYGLHVYPQPQ